MTPYHMGFLLVERPGSVTLNWIRKYPGVFDLNVILEIPSSIWQTSAGGRSFRTVRWFRKWQGNTSHITKKFTLNSEGCEDTHQPVRDDCQWWGPRSKRHHWQKKSVNEVWIFLSRWVPKESEAVCSDVNDSSTATVTDHSNFVSGNTRLQMSLTPTNTVIDKNEDGSDITQDVDVLVWPVVLRDITQDQFPRISVLTRVFSFAGLTLSDLNKSLIEDTLEGVSQYSFW